MISRFGKCENEVIKCWSAQQQQTEAATARPVAARWNHKAAAAQQGGETRARSQGSNPRLNSFWFQQQQQQQQKSAAATAAAARASGNEINTPRRSNALLTCRLAVF